MGIPNEAFAAALGNERSEIQGEQDSGHDEGRLPPEETVISDDDWIPADKFQNLDDEVKREMRRRLAEVKELKRTNELLMARASQPVAPKEEKSQATQDEWSNFSDAQLRQWVSDAETIMTRLATADRDSEEFQALAAEAQKIKPEHKMAVMEELYRRRARSELEPVQKQLQESRKGAELQRRLEQALIRDVGADALQQDGDGSIIGSARNYVSGIAGDLGVDLDHLPAEAKSLITGLSVRLAHAEHGNRARSGRDVNPSVHRALDLDGATRRSASTAASRSAALARGDHEAVFEKDLDAFLGGMLG